ncbi:hypothetical protein J2X61_000510 [Bacillus sp. 3255]|nr:hypothetical protein [Bacillus sp. 3255]
MWGAGFLTFVGANGHRCRCSLKIGRLDNVTDTDDVIYAYELDDVRYIGI